MSSVEPRVAPSPPPAVVSAIPGQGAALIELTIAAGTHKVWVWRESPSGAISFVRGAVGLLVGSATTLSIFDFEVPLGVPVVYYTQGADSSDVTGIVSDPYPFELPSEASDDPWLTDLASPPNSHRVIVEALPQLTYAIPANVHEVLGRRSPIVTSDVAKTSAFELTFVTSSDGARDDTRALLGNGIPVLLRTPPEHGVGSLYMSVLGWSESRVGRLALHSDRRFVVQGREVTRPDAGLYVPIGLVETYAGVRAEFDDYAEVLDLRNTYAALLVTFDTDPLDRAPPSYAPWPARDA